jgi:lipid-binding SYLF domain-containing protein
MKNNNLLKALTVVLCLVLALAFFTSQSFATTKGEVDASVKAALDRFQKEVKGAPEYLKAAKGVLVMPNITKAGFIVGAQYGTGALKVGGKTVGYYSLAGGSLKGAKFTKTTPK